VARIAIAGFSSIRSPHNYVMMIVTGLNNRDEVMQDVFKGEDTPPRLKISPPADIGKYNTNLKKDKLQIAPGKKANGWRPLESVN